jgi:transposase
MEPEAGAIHPIKLNDVDPQAWLPADHPASRIAELLPWIWKAARFAVAA